MIDVEMLRPTADEMLSGFTAGESIRKRLLFQARAVEQLPEIANELLGGLVGTPALRHRILVAASRKQAVSAPVFRPAKEKQGRPALTRVVPALGMALVLTLMIGLGAQNAGRAPLTGIDGGMEVQAAGQQTAGVVPQYRSLFAPSQGANPPLVGIMGRYYRMLNGAVPSSALDSTIAEVQTFAQEPSLAGSISIVSNVLPAGTKIYSIKDISSKTLCAAEVDGVMRLFQRVGYASSSLLGGELFDQTLDVINQVSTLELSGVGIVYREDLAYDLIYTLYELATFHSDEIAESGQALTIYLKNGLSVQLIVQDDIIGGCGAWACPEFFEAFEQALIEQASES